jgi:hypothetical protein
MTLGTGGEIEPGEMPGGVGTTPFEADPFRLQPPPALVNPPTAPAGGDPPTGEQDPVGVRQEAAGRGGADTARRSAAERDARDLTVGRPLAATDQCRDGGDPVAGYSGSTQTLVAVSRLNVSSRSAARSRIVLPTPSTSSTTTRVPGTRFRSWR